MSKNLNISNNLTPLPPLQKRIVLYLAHEGPQTVNRTCEGLRSHYKPTWVAFGSLKKKGLIEQVNLKKYRNRNYPQYWLTTKGVLTALKNGAKIQLLERNVERLGQCDVNPTVGHEGVRLFFDFVETLGLEHLFKIINIFQLENGELKLVAVPIDISPSEARKLLKIVKKYPMFTNALKKTADEIKKLVEEE